MKRFQQGNEKRITTQGEVHKPRIVCLCIEFHRHSAYATFLYRIFCENISVTSACNAINLIASGQFVPFIYKTVITGYNEMNRVCRGGQPANQSGDLINGLFTCNKHFVFCFVFIPPGIDLIMIDINDLLSSKDRPQFFDCHTHRYSEEWIDGRLWLNPGSCGKARFGGKATMAKLFLYGGKIERIQRIVLEKQTA